MILRGVEFLIIRLLFFKKLKFVPYVFHFLISMKINEKEDL